ncbi:MAG TPA: hypothetical protein VNO21_12645 [Polyangiaceae bacterium]|nr:hypothetical protein [Polyangiaceae bacterium]
MILARANWQPERDVAPEALAPSNAAASLDDHPPTDREVAEYWLAFYTERVARRHRLEPSAILAPCRKAHVVRARDELFWRLREAKITCETIALLVHMDRTSVAEAVRRHQRWPNARGALS